MSPAARCTLKTGTISFSAPETELSAEVSRSAESQNAPCGSRTLKTGTISFSAPEAESSAEVSRSAENQNVPCGSRTPLGQDGDNQPFRA